MAGVEKGGRIQHRPSGLPILAPDGLNPEPRTLNPPA